MTVPSHYETRTAALAGAVLLAVSVFARLPFFFPAVISWDESTFILMGQEVVDGRLPYLELWDVKPPLAFVAFGLAIAVFGHSIEAIRLAGTICVFFVAYSVWLVTVPIAGARMALVAGIVVVLSIVSVQSGNATVTEHFATVPLCFALVLLSTKPISRRIILVVGALLAVAALIRTNLAYVGIAVAAGMSIRPGNNSVRERVGDVLLLGGSAVFVAAITAAPYLLTDQIDLLIRSVLGAALSYASTQLSAIDAFERMIRSSVGPTRVVVPLLLILACAGVVRIVVKWRDWPERQTPGYWLMVFLGSTLYSVAASGGGYAHYLIQVLPLLVIASAYNLPAVETDRRLGSLVGVGILLVATVLAQGEVVKEYIGLVDRFVRGEAIRTGRAWEVARYLQENNHGRDGVYLMEDHIAYWLTAIRPPTRMSTHPSNITKAGLIRAVEGGGATPLGELERVFETSPRFVIKPRDPWYLEEHPEMRRWLGKELTSRYRVVAQIDALLVYRRISD
jgi:4-amino-4-deoxy-L-arabinose transferase-like glycosyltransferase